jgi:hypothetical protein
MSNEGALRVLLGERQSSIREHSRSVLLHEDILFSLRLGMKRTLSAAIFSAAFCAVSSSVYFTVYGALESHAIGIRELATGLLYVSTLAALPAAVFGFLLGLVGGWILPHLPLVRATRRSFVFAAAVTGGILGCIPPLIPRLLPNPNQGETLSFVPSVLIGVVCASLWAWVWFRNAFGSQSRTA